MQDDSHVREVAAEDVHAQRRGELTTYVFYSRRDRAADGT